MLRLAGAICIVAGSTGVGFWYRRRLHEALWHLRYLRGLLELFLSEVRYGKATLPECCKKISEKAEAPYGEALDAIYRESERHTGESFFEIWSARMGQALAQLPITGEERALFLDFPKCTGHTDRQMQLKTIEQHRDLLSGAIKVREDNLERQGRLAAGLGMMSGLLLTVLLL